jgi:hypothetical protein
VVTVDEPADRLDVAAERREPDRHGGQFGRRVSVGVLVVEPRR